MKIKWYISALIVIVSFFVVEQQREVLPNQEMVLHFSDSSISPAEADHTLEVIESKLLDLGVERFELLKLQNGGAKITYFSTLTVVYIKERLLSMSLPNSIHSSGVIEIEDHKKRVPIVNELAVYQFDIYEIQQHDRSNGLDVDGKCYFEIKSDNHRGNEVKMLSTASSGTLDLQSATILVKQKVNSQAVYSFQNTSCTTPETRAGPIS